MLHDEERPPIEHGMVVVDHAPAIAARFQNPMRLPKTSSHVGSVMEHAIGINHVERTVGKRQGLGIGFPDVRGKCVITEMFFRAFYVLGGNINPGIIGAIPAEFIRIVPGATADFEDLLPAKGSKGNKVEEPGHLMARALLPDIFEELLGAPSGAAV